MQQYCALYEVNKKEQKLFVVIVTSQGGGRIDVHVKFLR